MAETDHADGGDFKRPAGDQHQFRFIISVEDGAEYLDLKSYVRRLMTQVEQDLDTKLDWVAVDDFDTERPHAHLALRGVGDPTETHNTTRNCQACIWVTCQLCIWLHTSSLSGSPSPLGEDKD